MFHNWKKPRAIGCALVLLGALATGRAAEAPSFPEDVPLGAEAFTTAVLARNASLEAMRAALVEALARIEPAGALDDPMLSITAAPETFGSELEARGQVQISQALPWWGTLEAREQVARAEAEATGHDLETLKLRLAAMARGAFADWVFVHRSLEVNAANQAVLADLRSIARVRYVSGRAPQQDVLQADIERALLEQQVLDLRRQLTVVQARMNALLNRSADAALPPPADLPTALELPPQEVLAERALAAHPQLEHLQALHRAAQAQVRLEQKARYPEFRLSAGYNNMWEREEMRASVGVAISLPLDQDKYEAAVDAARARARRAAATLEDQRASLLAEVAAAYAGVREAAESIALYRDELVPLAQDTLEVAQADYGGGRGDFLNVLTAERHRLNVELGLARLQAEYFRRLAELERATGGLLDPRPGSPPDATVMSSEVNHD